MSLFADIEWTLYVQKKKKNVYQVEIFDQAPSSQLGSRVLPLEKLI